MRKHGLACDNLRSAEVVTADGQILTASASENPDLFWGLRGGGGNFGVVTSFEFDLHPVGPTVTAGPVFYPGERAEEILRFYRDFVRDLPDELTTLANLLTAPPAPFLPEEWHGKKLVALIGCYSGDPEEGAKAMQPLRELGDPVADLVGPMPYVQMQGLIDALYPHGTNAYMKAGYLRELDDHAIETAARYHQDATSPASEIHIHHFGGAVARVGEEETAYGERQAPFVLNIVAMTHEPGRLDTHIEWAQRLYARDRALADRRRLHQLPLGRGGGAGAGGLRGGEVRPPPGAQGPLRPDQPVPPEPEHPAVEGSLSGRPRQAPGAANRLPRRGCDTGDTLISCQRNGADTRSPRLRRSKPRSMN